MPANKYTYTPILKCRLAEIFALKKLSASQRVNIFPLLQLVDLFWKTTDDEGNTTRHRHTNEHILQKAIRDIKDLSDIKVFLDVSILYQPYEKEEVWGKVFAGTNTLFGSNVIPTLTLDDLLVKLGSEIIKNFIAKQGIAIRVYREDIDEKFWSKIDGLLLMAGLDRQNVDLIIDYQVSSTGDSATILEHFRNPNNIKDWRKIIFVSGAFVEDLSGFEVDTTKLPRDDWKIWNDIIKNLGNEFPKSIGYGDYTIQHPLYKVPPEVVTPTRSIKYTKKDCWLILKGLTDTAKGSLQAEQYYWHLQILNDGKDLFKKDCCWGDEYIQNILTTENKDNCGGFPEWVKVGINHHISLTIKQLASLG